MSTIVRISIDHADAEAARQTVLRSGLTLDCVALSCQGDEAGAVHGNFVSGDHQPRGEMAETYESKFQNVVLGGRYVLIVEADPTEAAATEVILAKAGGAAIDDLCPGHRPRCGLVECEAVLLLPHAYARRQSHAAPHRHPLPGAAAARD